MAKSRSAGSRPKNVAAHSAPTVFELVRYWGTVVAWMAVISMMSSEPFSAANTHRYIDHRYIDPVLRFFFPELTASGFVLAHSIIRKAAHLAEFAVLGALAYWASRRGRLPAWRNRWALQALLIASVFALIDETHQRFVASRTGSLADSFIDICGAVLSQVAIFVRSRRKSTRQG
jgi:VanZ family protein